MSPRPERVRSRLLPALALTLLAAGAVAQAPQLPPLPVPSENPITESKRVLGKILFWDEQLSSDNTTACGTCHLPATAGADPRLGEHPGPDGVFGTGDDLVGSPGVTRSDATNAFLPDEDFGHDVQVTGRSAPSYFSLTQYAPELFWDGRATDVFTDPQTGAIVIATNGALESQAVGPILSPAEMGHDGRTWGEVIAKLEAVIPLRLASDVPPDMANALLAAPTYPDLFLDAFGTSAITAERIGRAIATYERTLVPDQTPYDSFAAGIPNSLTPQQAQGLNILNNTLCNACHAAPFFTDFRFHNLGLRPGAEDIGRQEVTGNPNDLGRFRTPSLRNAGLKDALMHVGWVTDVRDAIRFYNAPAFPATANGHTQFTADQTGVPTPGPGNTPLQNINIGPNQIGPLVSFLEDALTDPRAAAETFPFDRPTLHSERATPNPALSGAPSVGGPRMLAVTPLTRANPDFKIGIGHGTAGATAWFVASLGAASAGTEVAPEVPLHVDPSLFVTMSAVTLLGSGSEGYATILQPIPDHPAFTGLDIHGQWIVLDPKAPLGISSSEGARWVGL